MNEMKSKQKKKGASVRASKQPSASKNAVQNVVSGGNTKQGKRNYYKKKTTETKREANRSNTSAARKGVSRKPALPLRIIPLGGLGEIGKNITLYEYDGDMILVDCGMSFPDEETPGIDFVIPDFSFIFDYKEQLKRLLVTHGHEDSLGVIPYML